MSAIGTGLFRQVMGHFATGVAVLTTRLGGEYHGMTANAVCSVSLDPLLVLVCVDRSAHTHRYVVESGIFALNILANDQEHLSRWFASEERLTAPDPLAGLPFRTGVTGAPLLEGCLANVDCRVIAQYDAGDHTIFVGRVEAAELDATDQPLVFYRGRYTSVG